MENPLSSELSALRPSLLPGLLAVAARNLARKREEGAVFELGPRFTGGRPGEQVWAVAGLRWGRAAPRHWAVAERPVDALDAKADALAALAAAGVRVEAVTTAGEPPAWYHPGGPAGSYSGRVRSPRSASCTPASSRPSTSMRRS
jgi:phenylalanyl-tRNA synthetase beta chain